MPKKVNKKPQGTLRIAIVNEDKCKPKKCRLECKRRCPVELQGKICVTVKRTSKVAGISEPMCIGCGICVKACPFNAINIINLPRSLEGATTHRYGQNSFKLHRLPMPRPGQVLGLVGINGIGKSTALKILAAKLKPNLGKFDSPPDWEAILRYFRGSELQNYFTKILEDDLKAAVKPQYVDQIPKVVRGTVGNIMAGKDVRKVRDKISKALQLEHLQLHDIKWLSGGELQRLAIAIVAMDNADVYMFDEPSSYLDVKQRLRAAELIRSLLEINEHTYVVAVEHDLSVLDYLSDYICCLYGVPGGYGVVTMPFSVREGINIFLAGHIPTENMRFRTQELTFKVAHTGVSVDQKTIDAMQEQKYPAMVKTLKPKPKGAGRGRGGRGRGRGGRGRGRGKGKRPKRKPFRLTVEPGGFRDSQIVVMLGENGMGKTTFIRMLAGFMTDDAYETAKAAGENPAPTMPRLNISYKPQKLSPSYNGSVEEFLQNTIRDMYVHPQFHSDVIKPMKIRELKDQNVLHLSGGELQRVALVRCLGTPADVYLLDEPSAYLDSEQRIIAARVIKNFIMHNKKCGFIVEHDFIMATYLADSVIVYEGQPGIHATARSPQPLLSGMNKFLDSLGITFRRDPVNYRPRINKRNSVKDRQQKKDGNFFYIGDDDDDDD